MSWKRHVILVLNPDPPREGRGKAALSGTFYFINIYKY